MREVCPRSGASKRWAEVARFVGQKKLSITADTYTHVMSGGMRAHGSRYAPKQRKPA